MGYTFIDLFSGAGGLSEGFIQAGFEPVAHVEMNRYAAGTLETRIAYHYLVMRGEQDVYCDYLQGKITHDALMDQLPDPLRTSVLCEAMSDDTLPGLFETIDQKMKAAGISQIDVVVGGPPCQAYSLVGRAQSRHMEHPMEEDPRNTLYKLYVRFLKKYKPSMFVFENVIGIQTANGGKTWKNIQKYMRRTGYEIECRIQNARTFGVLQDRKRVIVVGWKKDEPYQYPEFMITESQAIVNDLFSDLPPLVPGGSADHYTSTDMSDYVRENHIREPDDLLTLHYCRPNIERDLEIYRRAIELWNDGHQRLNYNDLPDELKTHKNRKSFLDRFKVVEGDEHYCHTMLAHISKDGHYFIHPDIHQVRSLSVREAARIQSFPDSYFFEGPRGAQFVQIGNAVPPLMARGIANGIMKQLKQEEKS